MGTRSTPSKRNQLPDFDVTSDDGSDEVVVSETQKSDAIFEQLAKLKQENQKVCSRTTSKTTGLDSGIQEDQIQKLTQRLQAVESQKDALLHQNARLLGSKAQLREENARLRARKVQLHEENAELRNTNRSLARENQALQNLVGPSGRSQLQRKDAIIARQNQELTDLGSQLAKSTKAFELCQKELEKCENKLDKFIGLANDSGPVHYQKKQRRY